MNMVDDTMFVRRSRPGPGPGKSLDDRQPEKLCERGDGWGHGMIGFFVLHRDGA